MKEKDKKKPTGVVSLIIGIILFCIILAATVPAVKELAESYLYIKNADLSQELEASFYYEDHLYASMGFGISIAPDEADKEVRRSDFLSDKLPLVDERIITCGILYAMMLGVIFQYYLNCKCHDSRKKYILGTAAATLVPFAAYLAAVLIAGKFFGVPFIFPRANGLLLAAVGLLSAVAGNSVLAALISTVRHKRFTAVAAVPIVFALVILGMNLEYHLYTGSTVKSFKYVSEVDSRLQDDNFDGAIFYNDKKDVLVVGETEYPPDLSDNPDYYTGLKRAGAYAAELIIPYSGSELLLTNYLVIIETEDNIPSWTSAAYAVKAMLWIAGSCCWLKPRRKEEKTVF